MIIFTSWKITWTSETNQKFENSMKNLSIIKMWHVHIYRDFVLFLNRGFVIVNFEIIQNYFCVFVCQSSSHFFSCLKFCLFFSETKGSKKIYIWFSIQISNDLNWLKEGKKDSKKKRIIKTKRRRKRYGTRIETNM